MEYNTQPLGAPNVPAGLLARNLLKACLWSSRMFGNTPFGVAMTLAYFRDDRWITAREAAELAEVSEDTARRILKPLVATRRVEIRKEDRAFTYRLSAAMAEKSVNMMLTAGTT